MRRLFYILLTSLVLVSCNKEPKKEKLNFTFKTLSESTTDEEKIGSTLKVDLNYHPPAKGYYKGSQKVIFGPHKAFVRDNNQHIPLLVNYYADGNKQVQFIVYEWTKAMPGITVEERDKLYVHIHDEFEIYRKKFYEIAYRLKDKYGKNIAGDGKLKNSGIQSDPIYKSHLLFEDKNTNKLIELNFLWIPMTKIHKIVLKIYDK